MISMLNASALLVSGYFSTLTTLCRTVQKLPP